MQTGGLPDELFDAYQREWPFEPGYEQRRPALQLHKMLVGLRHFGPARMPGSTPCWTTTAGEPVRRLRGGS